MATTSLNTTRTEMRASNWTRAFAAACPQIVAADVMPGTSNALAARYVR